MIKLCRKWIFNVSTDIQFKDESEAGKISNSKQKENLELIQ